MKLFAEPAGSRHRLAYLMGAIALIAFSLLMIAGRASADLVYWVNQNSVAYSQLDDKAGGFLPESVNAIHTGMGTAIDTANGRIYVAQEGSDQIVWFGLDGVGAGVVNAAPSSVDHPTNVSIDPETQTLYWANDVNPGSIGFARVDGSESGILAEPSTSDASVEKPSRIAIDMLDHRIYWWNELGKKFSWVTTDGIAGADLSTPGLTLGAGGMGGMTIEPFSTPEEIYFMNNEREGIFHTDPKLGGPPEEVQGAVNENVAEPIGLAFDGTRNKFYWANRQADEEPRNAIGTATLSGQPANITTFPLAPIHSPAFAAILRAPASTGAPTLSASDKTLTCTLGEWEGDHPGASVYAAPTSYKYQWRKGSAPIAGATDSSFTATESGSYSCEIVAVNAAGETGKTSKSTTLTFPSPPKTTTPSTPKPKVESKPKSNPPAAMGVKLASSKPAKVKAGGTAVIQVDLTNSGKTTSGAAKVCGTLSKKAKKGLVAPKCVTVKSVAAGKTAVAKLMVKTKGSARGAYKFTVAVSGAATGSLTAKIQVTPPKRK